MDSKMRIAVCLALLLFFLIPVRAAEDDVQLLQADINISSNGDNTVITAPAAGKRVFVYKFWFVTSAAVNITFKDGASTSFNANALPFIANGSSFFAPFDGKSYFEASAGNAFIINLSAPVQVTGRIYYALR